jgi:Calpain family cysteine protease
VLTVGLMSSWVLDRSTPGAIALPLMAPPQYAKPLAVFGHRQWLLMGALQLGCFVPSSALQHCQTCSTANSASRACAAEPYADRDGLVFPEAAARWLDSWQRPAAAAAPAAPAVVALESVAVDGKPKLGGNSGRVFEGALYFGHPQFEWLMGQLLMVQQLQAQLPKGQYLFELIHPQTAGLPVVSRTGKYAVKLFVFDSWRAVAVDDRVPLDLFGRALVVASRPFQLWPVLLSKAVMKVMAAYHVLERAAPHEVRWAAPAAQRLHNLHKLHAARRAPHSLSTSSAMPLVRGDFQGLLRGIVSSWCHKPRAGAGVPVADGVDTRGPRRPPQQHPPFRGPPL